MVWGRNLKLRGESPPKGPEKNTGNILPHSAQMCEKKGLSEFILFGPTHVFFRSTPFTCQDCLANDVCITLVRKSWLLMQVFYIPHWFYL